MSSWKSANIEEASACLNKVLPTTHQLKRSSLIGTDLGCCGIELRINLCFCESIRQYCIDSRKLQFILNSVAYLRPRSVPIKLDLFSW